VLIFETTQQQLSHMVNNSPISISKLDAARRQLEVAIRLYFFNDDPVSIYTLGAAAYSVMRDIASTRRIPLHTGEQLLIANVIPGKERELLVAVRRHQNFFKHADKDPDAIIDFNPDSTEWILYDGCVAYSQLTSETTPLMGTFNMWWQFRHSHLIKIEYSEVRDKLESDSRRFPKGRREYFSQVLPLFLNPNVS
jgi:hypothetical protein